MPKTAEDAMAEVLRWVQAKSPSDQVVTLDTDLIDTRLIDSLTFVEFLFLLEQLSGRPVLSQQIQPEHFRTLRQIRQTFFPTES